MTDLDHVRDGAEIYRRSFETIRNECDLTRIPAELERVVVRMVHACGMVDLVKDVAFSADVARSVRRALTAGAPILVDSQMVAHGITRARLPADNAVICLIRDEQVARRAQRCGTTRSAAAVDEWHPWLDGAVVGIGNAPTALFRLLELVAADGPRPAGIIGVPVGFVGAAESKRALSEAGHGVPFLTVHGRRGGSAITAAALNALAQEAE